MTDRPPTCHKRGRRIRVWLSGETISQQVVKCEHSHYTFRLEADTED